MDYIDDDQCTEIGLVLEVNRQLLHPRGMAAERLVAPDGSGVLTMTLDTIQRLRELLGWAVVNGLSWPQDHLDDIDQQLSRAESGAVVLRVQDHRTDPEGVYYADLDDSDIAHAVNFAALLLPTREAALGYMVQPLATITDAA